MRSFELLTVINALVSGGRLGTKNMGPEPEPAKFQPFQPFQADYPLVSYADLYQMAAAVSIEHAGGPKIDMKYGRKALVAGVW